MLRQNVKSVQAEELNLKEESVNKDKKNTKQKENLENKKASVDIITPSKRRGITTSHPTEAQNTKRGCANEKGLNAEVDEIEIKQKTQDEVDKETSFSKRFTCSKSFKRKLEDLGDTDKVTDIKRQSRPTLGTSMRRSRRSIATNDAKAFPSIDQNKTVDAKVKSEDEKHFNSKPKPPKIPKSSKVQANISQEETHNPKVRTPEKCKIPGPSTNVDSGTVSKNIPVEPICKIDQEEEDKKIEKNVQKQANVQFFGLFKFASPKPSQVVKTPASRPKPASFLKMGHLKPEMDPESPTKV